MGGSWADFTIVYFANMDKWIKIILGTRNGMNIKDVGRKVFRGSE